MHARLVLRLLYVSASVCLCVYVCVCVRPQLSRALSYVIPLLCHYSHKCSGRKARLVLCCLDGERVVVNNDNCVYASSHS